MVAEHKKRWQRLSQLMRDYCSSGQEARGVTFKDYVKLADANASKKRVNKKHSTYGYGRQYGWQKEWFYGREYYWHLDAEPGAWYRRVPVTGAECGFVYYRMADSDWALDRNDYYWRRAVKPVENWWQRS